MRDTSQSSSQQNVGCPTDVGTRDRPCATIRERRGR